MGCGFGAQMEGRSGAAGESAPPERPSSDVRGELGRPAQGAMLRAPVGLC